jgi:manganese/zinc/iron transport system permease protein
MTTALFEYFTDPILRAPTIGSMLMCLSVAIIGVIAYLRKESLLGEVLSHASYPGVLLGVILTAVWAEAGDEWLWVSLFSMAGAFVTALLGLYTVHFLENRLRIRADSALCFILSLFFGVGIVIASRIQFTHSALYKHSLGYLYGQAATMTDQHIFLYGILSVIVIGTIFFFYKELKVLTFDRDFALSLGMRVHLIDVVIFTLLTAAIVMGIRSVGVVLISAMLIAPAVAARQFTHRLSKMLLLAACFGLISGFLGNFFSVELNTLLYQLYPEERLSLPTGPMIVLVAASICLFSLLFAPERGLVSRFFRIAYFRYRCLGENLLKMLWKEGKEKVFTLEEMACRQTISPLYFRFLLFRLVKQGWLEKKDNAYRLTEDGIHRAGQIVRLHRLWEVYLADYLGVGAERVHKSAEEMEHIITPELEKELTRLLKDPKVDPHHQPIPPSERK